jgi:hypothetical protein
MSRAAFDALGDYVRDVADRMGLRDWHFDLMAVPLADDDEALACITCTYGRKRARISVCHDWNTLKPEDRRKAIVHELVHPHFDSALDLVNRQIGNLVGNAAGEVFRASHTERMEFGVDAMADVIAPLMPPYPAEKRRKRR